MRVFTVTVTVYICIYIMHMLLMYVVCILVLHFMQELYTNIDAYFRSGSRFLILLLRYDVCSSLSLIYLID